MQLGRDAQIHIDVERVVVCDKRTRNSTARFSHENRRFHLYITDVIEIFADGFDDKRPCKERFFNFGVHNQVHIALTIPQIGILKAMKFLGQRQQRLGQQLDHGGFHRYLARVGLEHFAFNTDDIADVKLFKCRVRFFTEHVAADIKLNLAVHILHM